MYDRRNSRNEAKTRQEGRPHDESKGGWKQGWEHQGWGRGMEANNNNHTWGVPENDKWLESCIERGKLLLMRGPWQLGQWVPSTEENQQQQQQCPPPPPTPPPPPPHTNTHTTCSPITHMKCELEGLLIILFSPSYIASLCYYMKKGWHIILIFNKVSKRIPIDPLSWSGSSQTLP